MFLRSAISVADYRLSHQKIIYVIFNNIYILNSQIRGDDSHILLGDCVGTASVSFGRGQHLTRSCTPWRALPTTLSHEARSTQTLVIQPAERVVVSTRSRWISHEAAAAFDIPSPAWDPSETVHSEVKVISIKHQ